MSAVILAHGNATGLNAAGAINAGYPGHPGQIGRTGRAPGSGLDRQAAQALPTPTVPSKRARPLARSLR